MSLVLQVICSKWLYTAFWTQPLPVCLAQLLSCTELHVSSSFYLVAVLLIDLCIQKQKNKT